jgi:hypothetical protein
MWNARLSAEDSTHHSTSAVIHTQAEEIVLEPNFPPRAPSTQKARSVRTRRLHTHILWFSAVAARSHLPRGAPRPRRAPRGEWKWSTHVAAPRTVKRAALHAPRPAPLPHYFYTRAGCSELSTAEYVAARRPRRHAGRDRGGEFASGLSGPQLEVCDEARL